MNITNAAILYDETFVVDHKYKALLQNIPTRHVITAIANDRERTEQITKLRNLDINNYFILGTLDSIKKVLGEKKKTALVCVHKCSTVCSPNNSVFIINLSQKELSSPPLCVLCSVSTLSPFCLTCVYISMTTLSIPSPTGDFPKLLDTHNVTFY